jgi:hypothetical protein
MAHPALVLLGSSRKLHCGQGNQCRTRNRQNRLFHFASRLTSRDAGPGAPRPALSAKEIWIDDDDAY